MVINNAHNMDERLKCQSGFTLVEMAIAMVIISFILSMGATLIPRLAYQYQEDDTYNRIQYVHKAISAYAQKHNRIPCPAEPNPAIVVQPYGTERGSGANGQNAGACPSVQSRHGIIPFRTLGLTRDDVKDSFGNLMTYRVSRTPTIVPNSATDRINNWCRIEPKWHDGAADLDTDKAAFCCGHLPSAAIAGWINQDTKVEGSYGPLPGSTRNIAGYGGNLGEYSFALISPPPTQATLQNTYRPSFTAYTIISHGPNGVGSYTHAGAQKTGNFLSGREADNADATEDTTYIQDNAVDQPQAGDPGVGIKQRLDIRRNDDIVSWRTPFQTYSALGNASCLEARP